MYVVLTYDVNVKRVAKARKICGRYLHHVQKSVFEGKITQKSLNELQQRLEQLIDCQQDGVTIYRLDSVKYACKLELGAVKHIDNQIG